MKVSGNLELGWNRQKKRSEVRRRVQKKNLCRGGRGKELRAKVSVPWNIFTLFISSRSEVCTGKTLQLFFQKVFLYRNLLAQTVHTWSLLLSTGESSLTKMDWRAPAMRAHTLRAEGVIVQKSCDFQWDLGMRLHFRRYSHVCHVA